MYEQISQKNSYLREWSQLSFAEENKTSLPEESPNAEEEEEDVEQVVSDHGSVGEYCFPLKRWWHKLKNPTTFYFSFFHCYRYEQNLRLVPQSTVIEFLCSLLVGLAHVLLLFSMTPFVVFHRMPRSKKRKKIKTSWKACEIGNGHLIWGIETEKCFSQVLVTSWKSSWLYSALQSSEELHWVTR